VQLFFPIWIKKELKVSESHHYKLCFEAKKKLNQKTKGKSNKSTMLGFFSIHFEQTVVQVTVWLIKQKTE